MRITIATMGSRGDVQPFIALGLGFLNAGHDVNLATHSIFEEDIRSHGINFSPIDGNPREAMESEEVQKLFEKSSRNPLAFIQGLMHSVSKEVLHQMMDDCWNACQGAEAIIHSTLADCCTYVAEKLRIPSFAAHLAPGSRTRAFPSCIGPQFSLGGFYNWMTYIITEQIAWQVSRPIANKWRKEKLDLQPLPFLGNFAERRKMQYPILYGYSASVVPKPPDWGDWIHVTGYWFLNRPSDWEPPADLVDFLQAGSPPVYIGFGSMDKRNPDEITEIVLKALDYSKQRGVILSGWGGLSKTNLPDNVFHIESAPHDWLLPQMAAVVHHGGAGTTAAGLRAGVPSIIVPFFAEQPFWGDRVYRLGAGPRPIPLRQLSALRLSDAINTAVSNQQIQAKASALCECICAEDGVTQAVNAFEHHISLL